MKTLKHLLLIVVISSLGYRNDLKGQGVYVNISTGYSSGMASQNLHYFDFSNYSKNSTEFVNEQVFVSLGKGFCFNGAIGYMFNKALGAELGLSYLMGGKSTAIDENLGERTEYKIWSNMYRINPAFILSSDFEKVNPYAKFGVVYGSGSIFYEVNKAEVGNVSLTKFEFSEGFALGVNATVGSNFKISDKLSFFGEINMINMSYAPLKGEIIEANYNGADIFPNMDVSEKEIEFVGAYSGKLNGSQSSFLPTKRLKQKLPFGSFGLNIGLQIGF